MIPDEFRQLIEERTDTELLGPCLHDDAMPYVFGPKPAAWDTFRDLLVSNFNVGRTDIRVVGSGRFGFSLKPGQNLKNFSDTSDIDVIVVHPALFDELWLALLRAAYPRFPLTIHLSGWLGRRRVVTIPHGASLTSEQRTFLDSNDFIVESRSSHIK